jgi:hypothetical protein
MRWAAFFLFLFWLVVMWVYVVKEGGKPPPKPRAVLMQPPIEVPKNLKDWI